MQVKKKNLNAQLKGNQPEAIKTSLPSPALIKCSVCFLSSPMCSGNNVWCLSSGAVQSSGSVQECSVSKTPGLTSAFI